MNATRRPFPTLILAGAAVLATRPVSPDEVHLKTGVRLSGTIVATTPAQVVIEVSDIGRVTVKQQDIRKVVMTPKVEPPPKEDPPRPATLPAAPRPGTPDVATPPPDPVKPPPDPVKPPPGPDATKPDPATPVKTGPAPETPRPPPATPVEAALRGMQESKDSAEQQKMLADLVKLGPPVLPELTNLLESDAAPQGWIVNAVFRIKSPDAIRLVLDKCKSPKPAARAAAATLLGMLGKTIDPADLRPKPPDTGAVPAPGTTPPAAPVDEPRRREEIDDRAMAALRILVEDRVAEVRAAALSGLTALYDVESAGVMIEALADPDATVRNQALASVLEILPRLPDPAAVPLRIVEILEGREQIEIVRSLLKALAAIGGKAPLNDDRVLTAVKNLIRHENEGIRADAFIVIGKADPVKSLDILTERLTGETNTWTRIQIMNAMARAGNAKAIPVLIDVLENDPSSTIKDGATRTLQTLSKQYFGTDTQKWRQWWGQVGDKPVVAPPPEMPHTPPK